MILTTEDQFILGCVKINLEKVDIVRLNALIPKISNWDVLSQIAIDRGIAPLIYKKIPLFSNQILIPIEVKDRLQQSYYITMRRSMNLLDSYYKIMKVFNENSISVIPLKGVFLSEWLYNDIGLRQFSDIDLLVKAEDGIEGFQVLKQMGFIPKGNTNISDFIESSCDHLHFAPMISNLVSVELHTKLHKENEEYNIQPDSFWNNAFETSINGFKISVLQINDIIIFVCLHLDRHFKNGQVQFTSFNDITNLIDKCKSTIDWIEFIKRTVEFKCEFIVMKYILMVHKFMHVDIPNGILVKYKYLLKSDDEKLFYKYLHGYSFKIENKYSILVHIQNIKRLNNLSEYVKYIIQIVFPSKKFMIQKYHIKIPSLFMFYYPYRYLTFINGCIYIVKRYEYGKLIKRFFWNR